MSFFSILDCDENSRFTIALSPYYLDFNIERIVKDINNFWREDVSRFYRYFPQDERGQEYRKEIYSDVCKPGMFELLMDFRSEMKQREEFLKNKELTRSSLQKQVMTLSEIHSYVTAVEKLAEGLSANQTEDDKTSYAFTTLSSEGMRTFKSMLEEYVGSASFKHLKEKAFSIKKALEEIPVKLHYQDRFINVSFEETEGRYDSFLREFNENSLCFFQRKNPFGDSVEITPIEEEILSIVCDKYPDIFKELKKFIGESEDYAEDFIVVFSEEIAFYLSFYTFEKKMEEKGLYFTPAKKAEGNRLMAEDLYDLALACQLRSEGVLPVANDMHLEEDENFFVLTGPNQGGKTTFARSLGQLIYFSKIGLPVPAKRAEIPFYSRILTHFSVEESIETGKGKLAEELSRLAPMMEDKKQKNDFVVINELFTTAANYDACIMGKRVLDHFIKQGCHGIYVTHLSELSKEDPGIVSLRAMMGEDHKQNFKIVRSTDPTLESSILLVEKHRLQFEQVKNRLKGEE